MPGYGQDGRRVTVEGNTMAEQSLEDILQGVEPTVEEVETEETPEVEPEAATTAVESEAKEEAEPEAKAEVEAEKEPWTKAAYLDEKRKRQDLEKQLKVQERKPLPDVIEDQTAFTDAIREDVYQTVAGMKIELSQDLMRELHEDYDEREAQFLDLAKDNPSLISELNNAANPARFAYETARKHADLQALKNVDEYKAKLRAEVEAELRSEILGEKASKEAKTAAKDAAITPSLVDAGETVSETEVEEALEDIIGLDANNRKK